MDKKNSEDFYKNLKKKLSNKRVVKSLEYHRRMIEEIMECSIDIQFISDEELMEMEAMNQKLKQTLEDVDELATSNINNESQAITLKDLKKMLTRENEDQKVFIDPIYLSNGMNPLNNMILVGMDNYVILIPKSEKINIEKKD